MSNPETKQPPTIAQAVACFIFGGATILFGVYIVGYQCLHWLDTAEWPPVGTREIIEWAGGSGPAPLRQRGAQIVLDWLLSFPFSLICFFFGAGGWLGGRELLEDARRWRERHPK